MKKSHWDILTYGDRKPSDRADKGSQAPIQEEIQQESSEHYHEDSSDNYLEVVKEVYKMKSSFDNLTTHINNLTRLLGKDYPHLSPTPSPYVVPQVSNLPTPRLSSLKKKSETESATTRREGYICGKLTRELFTPNYQTLGAWNMERRASTVDVPEWMPVSFRPPKDMVVNELEAAVAAYIFQTRIRESIIDEEVLVDCMWGYGKRGGLNSLFPKKFMDQEVLNMLAARLTYNEKSITGFSTSWFLPTSFSQYALDWKEKTSPEQLMHWYKRDYMGTIELLSKIFVPMNDDNAHWFLLIVDLRRNKLILLDSSPLTRRKEIRIRLVKRLVWFLEEMIQHSSFYEQNNTEKLKFSDFEIVEPEGIGEQLPGSNDCGVWVAQWMTECSSYFDDYDKVHVNLSSRMRIAIDLVMHPYNKIKDEVARRAIKWWTDFEAARKNLVKK